MGLLVMHANAKGSVLTDHKLPLYQATGGMTLIPAVLLRDFLAFGSFLCAAFEFPLSGLMGLISRLLYVALWGTGINNELLKNDSFVRSCRSPDGVYAGGDCG